MTDDVISRIEARAGEIFIKLGFEETYIKTYLSTEKNYRRGNSYYRFTFVRGLGFIIESASSYDEACKNGHEDSDILSASLGEEGVLSELESTLIKYYLD